MKNLLVDTVAQDLKQRNLKARYDQFTSSAAGCRERIDQALAKKAENGKTLQLLIEIGTLAQKVPTSLAMTSISLNGTVVMPGGGQIRTMFGHLVSAAIEDIALRDQMLDADIARDKASLENWERGLAEVEAEAAQA